MKRILAVGMLAAVVAATAQGQLTAAGSNFTGPGGGGGGVSSTIGAYVPLSGFGTVATINRVLSGFRGSSAPVNITVGTVTVSVDAATQRSAAGVILGTVSVASFAATLTGVPSSEAQALGSAMRSLRGAIQTELAGRMVAVIDAFNAAINAMPTGTPIPPAIIAARALILGTYMR